MPTLTPINHPSMRAEPRHVAKASERMLPSDERRQTVRLQVSHRSHVSAGIRGGQGRSGAEIEEDGTWLATFFALGTVMSVLGAIIRWVVG